MNRHTWVLAGLVVASTAVAAWLRLYDLASFPPGLWPDVAINGLDAQRVLAGDFQVFYSREGLWPWLLAGGLALFGMSAWSLLLVSSVVGIATVPAVYWAVRSWFGPVSGVVAAWLVATSAWHITLSRSGFRAVLVPLLLALFVACVGSLVAAGMRKRWLGIMYGIGAGAMFALGWYSYGVWRLLPGALTIALLLGLFAALHPRFKWSVVQQYVWPVVSGVVVAIALLLPIGWYFGQHPEVFWGTTQEVSVFNPVLQQQYGGGTVAGALGYGVRTTLSSLWISSGDTVWRHAVVGHPLLNPVAGGLVVIGIIVAGYKVVLAGMAVARGEWHGSGIGAIFFLLLLAIFLVPAVLAIADAPHALRLVGALVPLYGLAGVAVGWVVGMLHEKSWGEWGRWVAGGSLLGLLLFAGAYDSFLYLVVARNSAAATHDFRADLSRVATYVQGVPAEVPVQVVANEYPFHTLRFLLGPARVTRVDAATAHLLELQPGEQLIFTAPALLETARFEQSHPAATVVEAGYSRFGQELFRVYQLPEAVPETDGAEPASLDA